MAVNRNDFVTGKGETFKLNISMEDTEGLVDLTGHTLVFHLKTKQGEPIETYPFVVESAGVVNLKITDETTATWPAGVNSYLLTHEQPNGDIGYVSYGRLTVMEV